MTKNQNKTDLIRAYQKSAVQERAALGDIQYATRVLQNPATQGLRHYLTEGTVLAERERAGELRRVQKHLDDLRKQVKALDECLAKNDVEQLRSLLLITKTNIQDARIGWESAAQGLEAREKALASDIEACVARQKALSSALSGSRGATDQSVSRVAGQPKRVAARLNLPEPLRLIEEELAHIGAPCGGWDAESHAVFYHQFVQSCVQGKKSTRVFLEQIARRFPLLQPQVLERHAEFCGKLHELLRRKSELVQQIRERRVAALQESQEKAGDDDLLKMKAMARKTLSDDDRRRIEERKEEKKRKEEERALQEKLEHEKEKERVKLAQKRAEEAAQKRKERQVQKEASKEGTEKKATEADRIRLQQLKEKENERRAKEQEQLKEKLKRKAAMDEQLHAHEQQIEQMARLLAPAAPKREENALLQPTSAQRLRIKEVNEARANGTKLGAVTTGFDPFALVPMGGLQRASWQ